MSVKNNWGLVGVYFSKDRVYSRKVYIETMHLNFVKLRNYFFLSDHLLKCPDFELPIARCLFRHVVGNHIQAMHLPHISSRELLQIDVDLSSAS